MGLAVAADPPALLHSMAASLPPLSDSQVCLSFRFLITCHDRGRLLCGGNVEFLSFGLAGYDDFLRDFFVS